MCQIGETGPLGLCACEFEFYKNTSIFLFFVNVLCKRKAKLK